MRHPLLHVMALVCALAASGSLEAAQQTNERVSESVALEQAVGRIRVYGAGKATSDVQRGVVGVQIRQLAHSPLFVTSEFRADREKRLPYDLLHEGGEVGLGWGLNETTDVLAKYRLDHYKIFNTSPNVDPAFRLLDENSQVSALGLELRHDTRDDRYYPTRGIKTKTLGELGIKGLGGDYNFGRLEADAAWYLTPWRERAGTRLNLITFVEHFRAGWVAPFGESDQVPFFERYFIGGTATVRGHRTRWLTPRGLEQQFVGGEIEVLNNIEARVPIFPDQFNRQLSAAVFFDTGRAYRRFSEIGDFGYGLGAGLRYVVHWWKIHGVIRVDYALSLDHEGDDSVGHWHISFGLPF